MKFRFIFPDSACWQEFVEAVPHDFYHLSGYAQVCAELEQGEPSAFIAEEGRSRLLIPLIIRPVEQPEPVGGRRYDATSPYGYPSPLLSSPHRARENAEFLRKALDLLLAGLRERGVVSLFLRLHPLLPLPLQPLRRLGTIVRHGPTVYHDLTLTENEIWRQTDRRCRKKIELAMRHGCVAQIDETWSCFEHFFEIYTQTMSRVGAEPHYFFPRSYFYDLKNVLRGSLHLWLVRVRGSVACAGLFSEASGIVQAHLLGSRPEYNRNEPTRLLMHSVRRWAKCRGNRLFHLGGGVGGRRNSLFQFKSGFSKLRGDFYTFRAVVDVEAYVALIRDRWPNAATHAVDPRDFFPAYRMPDTALTATCE